MGIGNFISQNPLAAVVGGSSLLNSGINLGLNLWQWHREDQYNQKMWDRDDNAMQRRVADLQKAGLSPVLATGAAGNSSPVLSSPHQQSSNFALDMLTALKGKADISATNAGTELTKFQAENEQFRKNLLNSQLDYTKAMAENKNLENSFYASDMASKLAFRAAQTGMLTEQQKELMSKANLNAALTAYKQTEQDLLKTQIDNAKIQREMSYMQAQWYPFKMLSEFNGNSLFGKLVNPIIGTFGLANQVSDLWSNRKNAPMFDRKQFWDYNN